MKYKQGFTLIEVMIALIIGIFLTAGVIKIFLGTKNTNRTQENLSRMQENARFAIYYLTNALQKVGFDGAICGRGKMLDTAVNSLGLSTAQYQFKTLSIANNPLVYRSLSGALGGVDNTGLNGSDSIMIRSLGSLGKGVKLSASMVNKTDDIQISSADAGRFSKGDIVLITDCNNSDIFQITNNVTSTSNVLKHATGTSLLPDNKSNSLFSNYTDTTKTKIYRLSSENGVPVVNYNISTDGNMVPGLMRGTDQLVPDIENMQIEYGRRDFATNNISYVSAVDIPPSKWDEVISVKIDLLVRSAEDFVATAPQSYFFPLKAGVETVATDKRLRKAYSTTVTIRNRMN